MLSSTKLDPLKEPSVMSLVNDIVSGEIQSIMTTMRMNERWQTYLTSDYSKAPALWLLQEFHDLRDRLSEVDSIGIARPFISVVRSKETTGLITGQALATLSRFICLGVFNPSSHNAVAALCEVAEAAVYCRFEATDPTKDEVVLVNILELMKTAISSPAGVYLPDAAVWEMIQTALRIFNQMRAPEYSEVLGNAAENTLVHLVRYLFRPRTFPAIHESNAALQPQAYGIPCCIKVLSELSTTKNIERYMNSLSSHKVSRNLLLILTAIEANPNLVFDNPSLLAVMKEKVCLFLLKCSAIASSSQMCTIIRIFHCILLSSSNALKMQTQMLFTSTYLRLASSSTENDISPKAKMVIIDGIIRALASPIIFRGLYVNYDCDPMCPNLIEDLIKVLCRLAYPLSGEVTGVHYLALKALTLLVDQFAASCQEQFPEDVDSVLKAATDKIVIADLITAFNANPKHALGAFEKSLCFGESVEAKTFAHILRNYDGVRKDAIGEFLTLDHPYNALVQDEFMRSFSFKSTSVEKGLRMLLETLSLPKEAQQIDRLLQSFGKVYHEQNPASLDGDSVHSLVFSMLILHTDAHSALIKKKMSFQDFINITTDVKGIENIPFEELQETYQSITTDEIKLSQVHLRGDVSDIYWIDLLNRSRTTWGSPSRQCVSFRLDKQLLEEVWRSITAVLMVVLNVTSQSLITHLCCRAVSLLGQISQEYNIPEVVEELVNCLYPITGLTGSPLHPYDLVYQFGANQNQHLAASMMFDLVSNFGSSVKSGWKSVFSFMFMALRLDLVKKDVFILDDFIKGVCFPTRSFSFSQGKKESQSMQSIFYSVSNFFTTRHTLYNSSNERSSASTIRALECVENCHLQDIVLETTFLDSDALESIVTTLIESCATFADLRSLIEKGVHVGVVTGDDDTVFIEKNSLYSPKHTSFSLEVASQQCCFSLQLLTDVLERNSDRVSKFWPPLSQLLQGIISIPTSGLQPAVLDELNDSLGGDSRDILVMCGDFIVEAACIASFKLVTKFSSEPTLKTEVFELLTFILEFSDFLNSCPPRTTMQIASGLHYFIESGNFAPKEAWGCIMNCLAGNLECPETFHVSIASLHSIIDNIPSCYNNYPHRELLFLLSVLARAPKSGNPEMDLVIRGYSSIFETFLGSNDCPQDRKLSVLMSLGEVSLGSNMYLRNIGFNCVSKYIHGSVVEELSPYGKLAVFNDIAIPMLRKIGVESLCPALNSRSRVQLIKIVCRAFLHHVNALASLQNQFYELWQELLSMLVHFSSLEITHRTILREVTVECIRNLVLVIESLGLFTRDCDLYCCGEKLWELTWATLEPVFPGMQDNLFPNHLASTPGQHVIVTLTKASPEATNAVE